MRPALEQRVPGDAGAKAISVGSALGTLACATVALAIVAVCAPDDVLRSILWAMYLAQYALVVGLVFCCRDRWLFVLSPSFVTVSYINFNNVLGAFFFKADLVALERDYVAYLGWKNLGATAALFLLANLAVILPYFLAKKDTRMLAKKDTRMLAKKDAGMAPPSAMRPTPDRRRIELVLSLAFCVGVLLIFSAVEWDLSFIGGSAHYSHIVRTLACLAIAIVLVKHGSKAGDKGAGVRYLAYLVLVAYVASITAQDKRQAIFLLVPIALVECLQLGQLRLNFRLIAVSALASAVVLVLVAMMSIRRGYGGYETESFWDARRHVVDYVQSERLLPYLGNNLEFNYAFYHAHQAVEYMYEKPDVVLYGSSLAKVLFLHVPRYVLPEKPESMATHYTRYHAPALQETGASWMSTIYAEVFWNFHIAGLLVLVVVYAVATRCFLVLAYRLRNGLAYRHLLGVYAYFHMMTVVRGSGFDQFFAYLLVGAVVSAVVFVPVLSALQRGDGSTDAAAKRSSAAAQNRP